MIALYAKMNKPEKVEALLKELSLSSLPFSSKTWVSLLEYFSLSSLDIFALILK